MLSANFFLACLTLMKRYSLKNIYQILLCTLLASYTLPSSAATFERLESKPLDELWLTAGFYSFHFEPDQPLEDNNIGAGLEYRYSTTSAIVAGMFRNSEKISPVTLQHTGNPWHWARSGWAR